jgi:aquaporin Z
LQADPARIKRNALRRAGGAPVWSFREMKKALAEFVGTFILVFFGCGAAVIAGSEIGVLGIAFAFGLALIAAAYGIGPISGCHINPAVSLGALIAERMELDAFFRYVIAQTLGAVAGAAALFLIMQGKLSGFDVAASGLGQNGWGPGYLGEYGVIAAFLFELIATFIFVVVILGATQPGAPAAMAGLVIGLTLVVIHIVGIQVTGVSVNPARSFGPALFAGAGALGQLWLFILAPLIGAALASLMFRSGALDAELD